VKQQGEKINGQTQDVYYIKLVEAYPDLRGRKVLVWVDDIDSTECHKMMDGSERHGVTCVHLHSTQEAIAFFDREKHLLKRPLDQLRIMTDMVRTENKKKNIEAGLELAKFLKSLKYPRGILCFTGSTYLHKNQEKFKQANLNVYATASGPEAELFSNFRGLPGTILND